jgi:hypothetical protein
MCPKMLLLKPSTDEDAWPEDGLAEKEDAASTGTELALKEDAA